ncbi:cupin domain-containing protein [Actinacidiphila paucisporea]|uniref:Antibiotic biosynthesis monooxygenase n=1 Tax=Actinacidiphila paucisporea TaxID=310782 RepID=A0A1M7NW97_9ACTN|nr:cupin domain-containing protein [Actinacidiphila paucisporea]SHN08376.1 Antibiotic biosynthesis monooxygenase [Actinacidiphila paucisporea]
MSDSQVSRIRADEIEPYRKRGGQLRMVLHPGSVGSRSGYMGTAVLQPGEHVVEHFHPYSEEFLFVISGDLVLEVEGENWTLAAGEGIYVPIGKRHRLRNVGTTESLTVYHIGPLAPDPSLAHVDTEVLGEAAEVEEADGAAGTARVLFMMKVDEDRREEFLAAYEKVRFSVAATPGHIRDQICQAPDDPRSWLIVSEWTTLVDFFTWEKSESHKEIVRPMRDCYSDPEFRSFTVVAETLATWS